MIFKNRLFSTLAILILTLTFGCSSVPVQAETGELFYPYQAITTGSWPEVVTIGDFNGDGRNDVALATSFYFDEENDYKLFVFLQDDIGGLSSTPVKYSIAQSNYVARPNGIATGDLNGNGLEDIAVGLAGKGIQVFFQGKNGELVPGLFISTKNAAEIKIIDLDDNGTMDLVGMGSFGIEAYFQLRNNKGNFSNPVVLGQFSRIEDFAIGNFGKGKLKDVVTAFGDSYDLSFNFLFQKKKSWFNSEGFTTQTDWPAHPAIAIGDVMGNRKNEVVVVYGGNKPHSHMAILSSGGQYNIYDSYDCPDAVQIANVSGGKKDDIIVLHGGWCRLGVYSIEKNGEIGKEDLYPIPYASHYKKQGIAIGDVSGDGKNDVVVVGHSGLTILYHTL